MNKKIRKIWNAATTVLVFASVVLAFLLVGVKLIGLDTYIVLSGSMEPHYQTGSLIYVADADVNNLSEGDVITFQLFGGTVATHRIVEVVSEDGLGFITKGDANDVEDSMIVRPSDVIGTPVFVIPYLGYLASYIQQPPGFYIAICAACLLALLVFIPDLIPEKKEDVL